MKRRKEKREKHRRSGEKKKESPCNPGLLSCERNTVSRSEMKRRERDVKKERKRLQERETADTSGYRIFSRCLGERASEFWPESGGPFWTILCRRRRGGKRG